MIHDTRIQKVPLNKMRSIHFLAALQWNVGRGASVFYIYYMTLFANPYIERVVTQVASGRKMFQDISNLLGLPILISQTSV